MAAASGFAWGGQQRAGLGWHRAGRYGCGRAGTASAPGLAGLFARLFCCIIARLIRIRLAIAYFIAAAILPACRLPGRRVGSRASPPHWRPPLRSALAARPRAGPGRAGQPAFWHRAGLAGSVRASAGRWHTIFNIYLFYFHFTVSVRRHGWAWPILSDLGLKSGIWD